MCAHDEEEWNFFLNILNYARNELETIIPSSLLCRRFGPLTFRISLARLFSRLISPKFKTGSLKYVPLFKIMTTGVVQMGLFMS